VLCDRLQETACRNLSVKQIGDLVRPLVARTLTGCLLSESALVKCQLLKQLRVVQLLLYILDVILMLLLLGLIAALDAAYCYRPSSVVCLSVYHSSEPCKRG